MIDHLQLENFKAFRQLSLRLAPLTLLSGVNAAGKSTIMQALALLRQSFDAGMLTTSGGGLLLNGDLVDLGVGQDVLHEDYATDPGQEHPRISINVHRDGHLPVQWEVLYERALHREADVLPLVAASEPSSELDLFSDCFQYLKADRIVPSVHYPKSYEAAVRRSFLGSRGEHTVNYLRVRGDDRVESTLLHHPTAKSTALVD